MPKIFWEKPPPDSGAIFQRKICFPIRGEIERQKQSVSIERVEHCLRVLTAKKLWLLISRDKRTRFGSKMFRLLALVFGIAWICEAWAQSSLPPCPSDASVWNRCIGTYTFFDGRRYIGEFRDDKRNGQGTYTWRSGWKFVGEWKDGKPNGQGTVTWPDGTRYIGEFPISRGKERGSRPPSEAFDDLR